jgi:hypothetical protein
MRISGILLWAAILGLAMPARPDPLLPQRTSYEAICDVVEEAARANRLSAAVLTRLIWYESGFQIGAVSRVGAQGVAQFMPATATEQGLLDPFDPRQAIPHAANLLADLDHHFGNIGLAVAAYNAGPNRVTNWLAKTETLPRETALFVLAVTGRSVEEWSASSSYLSRPVSSDPQTCVALTALLPAIQLTELGRRPSHMIPGLERSGLVLPALRQSGHPLPEFQQSGRMLPGLE